MAIHRSPGSAGGGGGAATVGAHQREALWNFAKGKYGTSRDCHLENFIGGTGVGYATAAPAGTGAAAVVTQAAGNGGIVSLSSGTDPALAQLFLLLSPGSSTGTPFVTAAKTGGPWFTACRLNPAFVPDIKGLLKFGMIATNMSANIASSGFDGSVSLTKFVTAVGSGSNVASATNMTFGNPATPTVGFYTLGVGFDGTTLSFSFGDPQVAPLAEFASSTALAGVGDNPCMPFVLVKQLGGGGNVVGLIDSIFVSW